MVSNYSCNDHDAKNVGGKAGSNGHEADVDIEKKNSLDSGTGWEMAAPVKVQVKWQKETFKDVPVDVSRPVCRALFLSLSGQCASIAGERVQEGTLQADRRTARAPKDHGYPK